MEKTILSNLIHNVEYLQRSLPHLKSEYFYDEPKIIFNMIKTYVYKYKKLPTKNALIVMLDGGGYEGEKFDELEEDIRSLENEPDDLEWLLDSTEEFCKTKAVRNAISASIKISDNAELPMEKRDNKIAGVGAITELLSTALAVCFDNTVGHDYFEDWETRYESYHEKSTKIPFRLNILNKITKGGVERKTLNILLMGVNVGKTLGLCSLAAGYVMSGYNVLYISMEMAEEAISKRIDANMLDIEMDELDSINKESYGKQVGQLKGKTDGSLIVKQYPTAAASVNHFRSLLSELSTKKSVYPDVVIVDYLGICASSRITGSVENTYIMVKSIAEELRGFAVENDLVVWSAAQTTRGAWGASDIEMGDTAESAGLPATCDFLLGGLETEETVEQGQQMFKQLKSRYGDKNYYNKFMLNVNKAKQSWADVDDSGFSPTENKLDKQHDEDKKSKMANINF
ncbi:replicative DNA helicase [Paraglaciecola Antarctic GD virus 1]|nr:replicative DNA helicase [Paraglaciecola Antarctic GD virus 1]